MGIKWESPKLLKPLRVMMCGAAGQGWYEASEQEKEEIIFPRFSEILKSWEEKFGARLIGTIDDDLFMVGPPGSRPWAGYFLYDVPDLDTVVAMIDSIRQPEDGKPRLDRFIRFEAIIGRPFFLLESSQKE